jgi:nitrogenase subunit NifH
VRRAEVVKRPVVDLAPDAPVSRVFEELAAAVLADDAAGHPVPTPIDEARFDDFIRDTFGTP